MVEDRRRSEVERHDASSLISYHGSGLVIAVILLVTAVVVGDWWIAAFVSLAVVIGLFAVRGQIKRLKRKEASEHPVDR